MSVTGLSICRSHRHKGNINFLPILVSGTCCTSSFTFRPFVFYLKGEAKTALLDVYNHIKSPAMIANRSVILY